MSVKSSLLVLTKGPIKIGHAVPWDLLPLTPVFLTSDTEYKIEMNRWLYIYLYTLQYEQMKAQRYCVLMWDI